MPSPGQKIELERAHPQWAVAPHVTRRDGTENGWAFGGKREGIRQQTKERRDKNQEQEENRLKMMM